MTFLLDVDTLVKELYDMRIDKAVKYYIRQAR